MRRPPKPAKGELSVTNDLPKPELLFDLSKMTLGDLQMWSLDRSSRHLKAAKAAWHEAVREQATALLAAYFLEYRSEMLERARLTVEAQTVIEFPEARKRA